MLDYSNFHAHRRENFKIPDQIRKSLNSQTLSFDATNQDRTIRFFQTLPLCDIPLFLIPQFIHCRTNNRPKTRFNLCTGREPYKIPDQKVCSRSCGRVAEDGSSSSETSKTSARLYGVTFQKTVIFIVTVLRTSKFQIWGLGSLKTLTSLRYQMSQNNSNLFLRNLSVSYSASSFFPHSFLSPETAELISCEPWYCEPALKVAEWI
jgi:hypothetical protein